MKKGRAATMTHDYKRHGTTTLLAALNVLNGSVIIGRCMQRHRHQEFIRFLNEIERTVPTGKLIHVVLDNYGAHKQAKVRHWLARHPRWIFHFTPTSCSWLNAVETFFAKLTQRRLKRGVFHSLVALQTAINGFVETHNRDPKPFVWKADPNAIIAAAKRGYRRLDQSTRFPRQSKPGQVNDPAFMPIELEQVYAVYLRKRGDNSTEDDDAYRLSDVKVVLYGPAAPSKRTFGLAPSK